MNLKLQIILAFTILIALSLYQENYLSAVLCTVFGFVAFMYEKKDKVMTYLVDKYIHQKGFKMSGIEILTISVLFISTVLVVGKYDYEKKQKENS